MIFSPRRIGTSDSLRPAKHSRVVAPATASVSARCCNWRQAEQVLLFAAITLFHFDDRSPTETLECFRHGRVALACLGKKQCVAHLTLYGRRESHVIGLGSYAPGQRSWRASPKTHSVYM